MRSVLIIIVCSITVINLNAQEQQVDSLSKKYFWNNGISLSPQMLFVGALDVGVYSNFEYHPFGNSLATLVGIDIRNKWLQLNISNSGLDTKSIRSIYSINILTYAGIGFTLPTKKKETNSFYLTANPYLFMFKEKVETPFINNTVGNNSFNFNTGLTWTNNRVTKKGKRINTQFYIPIFGGHFLDELRTASLRIGISI